MTDFHVLVFSQITVEGLSDEEPKKTFFAGGVCIAYFSMILVRLAWPKPAIYLNFDKAERVGLKIFWTALELMRYSMKKFKILLMLLLVASATIVHAESKWEHALQVDSTDALDPYWQFNQPPSMEANIAVLRAGGNTSLTTQLDMLVREDGSVAARVARSSGNRDYDRAVLAATEEMRFEPASGNEQRRPVIAPFTWNHGN